MKKISGVIITFNEEKNIARCINSIAPLCDEIVVVDSFSTDRTKEICHGFSKIKFFENPFGGHIEQKNYALEKASNDYCLCLDADEALSDELFKSIKDTISGGEETVGPGYFFNRRTNYVDQWIYHCDWYPDKKLRLFNKNIGKWTGTNPHDIIKLSGDNKEAPLGGDLLHYSYDSITDHVSQTNKFTTIAAKAAYNEGKKSSLFKIVSRPFFKFLKDYLLRLGFLDGRYGFIVCYINALSALLKYSKLYDLQKGRSID